LNNVADGVPAYSLYHTLPSAGFVVDGRGWRGYEVCRPKQLGTPSVTEIKVRKRAELAGTTAIHYYTQHQPPAMEPLVVSIPEVTRIAGISRSEVYRRLCKGQLRAIKSGARTLILMESLRQHLASLPAATFTAPVIDI
jgi:hypothetical protein